MLSLINFNLISGDTQFLKFFQIYSWSRIWFTGFSESAGCFLGYNVDHCRLPSDSDHVGATCFSYTTSLCEAAHRDALKFADSQWMLLRYDWILESLQCPINVKCYWWRKFVFVTEWQFSQMGGYFPTAG